MIITCNCGLKKFSLPDNSIPAAGRMVQCGSCGLKWKQFPVNEINNTEPISNIKNLASEPKQVQPKRQKAKKVKKTSVRKRREIDLYSPEYLAKKHGIELDDDIKITSSVKKVSFGFYNSLVVLIVLIIALTKILHFSQDLHHSNFQGIRKNIGIFNAGVSGNMTTVVEFHRESGEIQ